MARFTVAILADDLTGALDSAVPFALAGLRTTALTSSANPELAKDSAVVALCTASREMSARDAVTEVVKAAAVFAEAQIVFKKVDSRLKGNVGTELAALRQAIPSQTVVVCPAIPELGRVVRGGHLTGDGVAIPINVADRFGEQENWIQFSDAETDADLDALVTYAHPDTLFVGARGLASALARRLRPGPIRLVGDVPLTEPIAIVAGSSDPITLAQIERAGKVDGVTLIPAADGYVSPNATSGAFIVYATPGPGSDPMTVVKRLAQGSMPHLAGCKTLVLTGGETAAAVLATMGVAALEVLGEAQPGMPICRPLDSVNAPMIITKSGGFGGPDALVDLIAACKSDVTT